MDITDKEHHDLLAYLYGRQDELNKTMEDAKENLKRIESLLPILNPCKTCKGSGKNPNYTEADRMDPNKTMTCPTCRGKCYDLRDTNKFPEQ